MTKFDFIAIGDITTDAFIKLQEAEINCDINKEACKICMNFGDKIPYESVTVVPAVGNSPNASVSASRLGLKSALVTNLGNDRYGLEAIEALKKNGVDTTLVKSHDGIPTNYHFVLWYGSDRTILVKHQEYEYKLPEFEPPKWLYLSSLGENSMDFHNKIAEYLEKNPEVKLSFQPGTFQMKLGYEALKRIYQRSELFFCNVQEAKRITGAKEADVKELLDKMHALGPKIVVITDGPEGAYSFDGQEKLYMPIYPDPKPPVDRTGAGDSFASCFTSALALGKTVSEALTWAPINSMNVVQYIGAQEGLLTQEKLLEWLSKAPNDYKIKKI